MFNEKKKVIKRKRKNINIMKKISYFRLILLV